MDIPDPELRSKYEEAEAHTIVAISKSLSEDVSMLFDPTLLGCIVSQIIEAFNEEFINQSSSHHQVLKQEAESIELENRMTIMEYFNKHIAVRNRMVAANYPLISSQSTTMEFIMSGLSRHPNFESFHEHYMLQGCPDFINLLRERLQKVEFLKMNPPSTKLLPYSFPPNNRGNSRGRGRNRYRNNNRWRNFEYHASEPTLTLSEVKQLIGSRSHEKKKSSNYPKKNRQAHANQATVADVITSIAHMHNQINKSAFSSSDDGTSSPPQMTTVSTFWCISISNHEPYHKYAETNKTNYNLYLHHGGQ